MKDIRGLHRQAMEIMRVANEKLLIQDMESYSFHLRNALELEEEAALELFSKLENEPTRSVLFRSAANIAFNLGDFEKSQKLIYQALAGNPYAEIKLELLDIQYKIQNALAKEYSSFDIAEYSYVNLLKKKAVNVKIEPKSDRYSKAIVIDNVLDFLKNIQISFKSLAEIRFIKTFTNKDFPNLENALQAFKRETRLLGVDLKFESFGIGLVADSVLMNNDFNLSPKFNEFKKLLFEDFKKDVIFADFNSENFHATISEKYTDAQRVQIYSSIISSLDTKTTYKVTIADENFKIPIKELPIINKKSQQILKPRVKMEFEKEEANGERLIKKVLELTDNKGRKKATIVSELMKYAEIEVSFDNIETKEALVQINFIDPYFLTIVFKDSTFIIDDQFFDIYVENPDITILQKEYGLLLAKKYFTLSNIQERTLGDEDIFQNMLSSFLTTSQNETSF